MTCGCTSQSDSTDDDCCVEPHPHHCHHSSFLWCHRRHHRLQNRPCRPRPLLFCPCPSSRQKPPSVPSRRCPRVWWEQMPRVQNILIINDCDRCICIYTKQYILYAAWRCSRYLIIQHATTSLTNPFWTQCVWGGGAKCRYTVLWVDEWFSRHRVVTLPCHPRELHRHQETLLRQQSSGVY